MRRKAQEIPRRGRSLRLIKWIVVGAVAAVALFYGGVLLYTKVLNKPEDKLSAGDLEEVLDDPSTTGGSTPGSEPGDGGGLATIDGTWNVTDASELGYRVKEVLGGVDTEAVGRTNQITGSLTIAGTQATAASFTVDVASITSDRSNRDGQFRGRIMEVDEFPTATFTLTEPIDFGTVPADGEQLTAAAAGDLTLHGVTRPVTFEVTTQLEGAQIGVFGNIPVVFADYEIVNPSLGPVKTEDNGLLEFVLVFAPA